MMVAADDLKHARGKRWGELFREYDATTGETMRQEARQIIARNSGSFRVIELARLAIKYDLPLKTTCRCLEGPVIPSGTYERLIERGLKVRKALEAAAREEGEGD